jgi:hypothetical protein
MRVWLKRKLAECIDGVDLSDYCVGDTLELPTRDASLLVAEEWAALDRRVRSDRRLADVPPDLERRAVDAVAISDRVAHPPAEDATSDYAELRRDGRLAPQSSPRRR